VFTIRVALPEPVTELGLSEQLGAMLTEGDTAQLKVTVPENPPLGVTLTVAEADAPAANDFEPGDTPSVKLAPPTGFVTVRFTVVE